MPKKELKTEYKVILTYGSEHQKEFMSRFMNDLFSSLKFVFKDKHKKNDLEFEIVK